MINTNKRQEKIEQVKKAINEGTTNAQKIAQITGLSINRVYEIRKTLGYSKKTLKNTQKTTSNKQQPNNPPNNNISQNEPKTTENNDPEEQTITADQPLTAHIPIKNGFHPYIPRRIGKTTDYKIIEQLHQQKRPTLLIGETGCGKTHLIRHLAYTKKAPYERINFDGSMTPDKLIGHWIPNTTGGFKWQDGILTKFVREGGIIVIDEINSGNADLLFFMHGLLDDERKIVLTEKDGEVIHAHPEFWLCATMNPDYEGTKPLNLALQDRFVIIEIDYDEKVEKQLINNQKLINLATRLRKLYREGEITTPTSTRTLMFYEQDLQRFGEETAQTLLLNKYRPEERNAIKEVLDLELNGKKQEEKKPEEQKI